MKKFFLHFLYLNQKIFSKAKIVKGMYNIRYSFSTFSSLDQHIKNHGIYNDWVAKNIGSYLPKGPVIFDVGANVGLLTLPFALEHAKLGRVFAFEPDRENFKKLLINIQLNNCNSIYALPYALQEDPSRNRISLNIRRAKDAERKINDGLSSIRDIPLHKKHSYQVKASTIDKIVTEYNLKKLDLIKIDVEGAEHLVLLGGKKSIKKYLPVIVYEASSIIDDLTKSQNSLLCFNFLQRLEYIQFEIVKEKKIKFLPTYSKIITSSNIICFHKTKIPPYFKGKIRDKR